MTRLARAAGERLDTTSIRFGEASNEIRSDKKLAEERGGPVEGRVPFRSPSRHALAPKVCE